MGVGEAYNEIQNVRHSSFVSSHYDILKRFKKISEQKHLRTFLTLHKGDEGKYSRNYYFLSYDVLHRMLPEFKFLRVLSLYYYAISELPKNIGDLRLLRHLNLSGSFITRLPDTVAVLYNLETLILYQCSYLKELPLEIKNLIELHELDLAYTKRLQEMPSGISSLTKLHKLSKFVVSKGDKNQIRGLQGLTRLRGKLSIYGLQNVQYIEDVIRANLKGKAGLDDIALIWSNQFDDSRDVELEMKVLDWLEPNKNLKVLEIESYGGNDFPSWLGNPYFVNMERITLLGCEKSKWLPSLGRLPLLNYLRIEGSNGVESVGREFSGSNSFPKLDTLETGVVGCKILVTTRNKFVTTTMNVTPYHLERLSVEDCKLILQDYALGGFAMLKNVQAWRNSPRHAIILKASLKDGVMKKSFKYEYVHLMLFEISFFGNDNSIDVGFLLKNLYFYVTIVFRESKTLNSKSCEIVCIYKNSNVACYTRIASFPLGIPIESVLPEN
ncbi:hypothetical protein ACFE04_009492 [Oxalis oulophora]